MEKYAWKAFLIEGKKQEYIKRHNEIWPEMKQILKKAGITNYSIWLSGNEIFGYYECENGIDYAAKVQKESEVVTKWNIYMKDVMVITMENDTGIQPHLEKVFDFN